MDHYIVHGCNCDDLDEVISDMFIIAELVRMGWKEGIQEIIDISRAASVMFPEFEWIY